MTTARRTLDIGLSLAAGVIIALTLTLVVVVFVADHGSEFDLDPARLIQTGIDGGSSW